MKRFLIAVVFVLYVCSCSFGEVAVDSEHFPDDVFREYVRSNFDSDDDGVLSDEEIAGALSIDIHGSPKRVYYNGESEDWHGVSDLIGIEYFTSLVSLDCSINYLGHIDLSRNTALQALDCSYASLDRLDLTANTALRVLICGNQFDYYWQIREEYGEERDDLLQTVCPLNHIAGIDLSRNTALEHINCMDCGLEGLNLQNNTVLKKLYCNNSGAAYISSYTLLRVTRESDDIYGPLYGEPYYDADDDGTAVTSYGYLGDDGIITTYTYRQESFITIWNRLQSLDLSSNTALEHVYCSSCDIEYIDVSGCPALLWLDCSINRIANLDVSNNTALEELSCNNNLLTNLDVSRNTALNWLNCGNEATYYEYEDSEYNNETYYKVKFTPILTGNINHITDLNLSNNTALGNLNCAYLGLTALDIGRNTSLYGLQCNNNALTELDVSKNTALYYLECSYNELTTLDLSKNTALTSLTCSNNKLTVLDLGNNLSLRDLRCDYNHLTTLEISKNTALTCLTCRSNDLTVLETGNKILEWFDCGENRITRLDLSKSTGLPYLYCDINQLETLDLSNNLSLDEVLCYSNNLTEIKLGSNSNLSTLYCSRNRLSALDISQCPELCDLSCAKNQIRELNLSKNTNLRFLYCHDNLITALDISCNPELIELSCTNNKLGRLDLSNNPELCAVDCGGNYLAELDVSRNLKLEELYFSGTTLRNVDVSRNTNLAYLDCISADMTTLDLSANIRLQEVNLYGNSRLEALSIISSDNSTYPFRTDMREYTGNNYTRIQSVRAYSREDTEINTSFISSDSTAYFASSPHYIVYDYSTGYKGSADIKAVPRTMSVRMGIPTHTFTYLPQIESKVVSVDSKVVSTDEINFRTSRLSSTANSQTSGQQLASPEPEETGDTSHDDTASDTGSGPGDPKGGCNSYTGISALLCIIVFAYSGKYRRKFIVLTLVMITASSAYATVKASDYTLPIPYEIYDIAGSWTTDFAFTAELAGKISGILGISADKVHSYADTALPGTWNVTAQDLYNLSSSGEYGGVILPLAEHGTSTDRYVVLCTFSNDIQPGEYITVHGFEVDTSTREAVYDEDKDYLAQFIALDDELNQVSTVPENRRIYLAVSFRPDYVNTGILAVVRGRYVEEEDPLYRLDRQTAQRIATSLGIDITELKYLTRANIGAPVPPTPAMQRYVKSDDHEIIASLPTVSVDEEGRYLIPVKLSESEWKELQSKDITRYKFYALNDPALGDEQFRASVTGLLNLAEVYTLTGHKMDTFSFREFFLAALLNAGQPFSLYIGKMLFSLLTGGVGCSTGLFTAGLLFVAGAVLLKLRHKR